MTASGIQQPVLHGSLCGSSWRLWIQEGMHHIDSHRPDSHQGIAAVDGGRRVGGTSPEGWKRTMC